MMMRVKAVIASRIAGSSVSTVIRIKIWNVSEYGLRAVGGGLDRHRRQRCLRRSRAQRQQRERRQRDAAGGDASRTFVMPGCPAAS